MEISRRGLLQGALATSVLAVGERVAAAGPARVFVVKGTDRARAVAACFDAAQFTACDERAVAIKANFNSGDAFPASDRKSTRLNSSHTVISYAVFCLKKKKITQ